MQIQRITTQDQFSAAVATLATLAVWTFGPLGNLPQDADDGEADEDDVVLLAVEDGETVGYLTADCSGVWCVEVAPTHRGRGIARALVAESGADTFQEVNRAGAALAQALGMEIAE